MSKSDGKGHNIATTTFCVKSALFSMGLLFCMGLLVAVDASDDFQKRWLRGDVPEAKLSAGLAETTNGGGVGSTQVSDRKWRINASVKGIYDNWDNDQNTRGSQFTEIFGLGLDLNQLFIPSDFLSVLIEGGAAQSDIRRRGSTTTLKVPTDTIATITYSTFDYKTWGLEGSLNFNFPTGKSRLTELELFSTPNPSVVSRSLQGAGFDVGFGLKYLQQLDKLRLFTGVRYTRRGSYDPTKERSGDTVSSGNDYGISLGGDYQFNSIFNFGVEGGYARSAGVGDRNASSYNLDMPVRLTLDRLSITGRFFTRYNDSEPLKSTTLIREREFQQGNTIGGNLEAGYKILDSLTLKALVEGETLTTSVKRPADPTFFATTSKYVVGGGAGWAIPGTNLTLDFIGRWLQVFTEDSNKASVDFSGFSFLLGVSGRF